MAELAGPEHRRRRRGFRMTAKYQVSGLRFLYRRMAHALVRRDTRMIDDPQRAQAAPLILGLLLALIMAVGTVVWGLFSPAGLVSNARIVVDRDTGAMYVRIGPRLDPVTNLTSARLILGSPDNPVRASAAEIAKYPHGSLVGIVGAPTDIRDSTDPSSIWTVCDTTMTGAAVPLDPVSGLPTTAMSPVTTTVIGGKLTKTNDITKLSHNQARLVSYDKRTWLIYARPDGEVVRSTVELTNSVVADALGLRASDLILPISQGLFNAIPAEPPLVAPPIAEVGAPPKFALNRPLTVGTILNVRELSGAAKYYVALADGVQEVGLVPATMIRAANTQVGTKPVEIGPDELASLPKSHQLEVSYYPAAQVQLVSAAHEPVTCWSWSRVGEEPTARTEVMVGRTLPLTDKQNAALTTLVSAPTSKGMTADRVYMPSGGGRFVQITGAATDSKNRESYFWIADNGVRFGLDTTDSKGGDTTLSALNLRHPVPAPWVVVSLFAPGPTLSQRDARIRHDGVPADRTVAGIDDKEMK
ncbi:type VII secretion protein EccB [Mycobacterium riyadhense]|uniref:type VII secretion protein EccB n=1 Tax=Mycobacterium riyadhense TaxID=486698 RepID=UPI00194F6DB3|nr:type VII secretion protein EccB [Mycobacterium riyadhense]